MSFGWVGSARVLSILAGLGGVAVWFQVRERRRSAAFDDELASIRPELERLERAAETGVGAAPSGAPDAHEAIGPRTLADVPKASLSEPLHAILTAAVRP
jgi:hypothetical protein